MFIEKYKFYILAFVLGIFVSFIYYPVPQKIEVPVPVVKQVIPVGIDNQIKACQQMIDYDNQSLDIAANFMILFGKAINYVAAGQYNQLPAITDQITTGNQRIADLTLKKQAIYNDCYKSTAI